MLIRLALVFFLAAPNLYADDAVPAELLGRWVFRELLGARLPSECRGMQMEFSSAGTALLVSGEQALTVQVTIERQRAVFVLHVQKFIEHNGKPNCQGRPADYVASHLASDVELEYSDHDPAVLRMYLWTKESRQFMEFIRLAPGGV